MLYRLSPYQPNARFLETPMHPRYGFIMSIVASRNISEGEEITVNYNYDDQDAPQWYRELKKGTERSRNYVFVILGYCC